MDPAENRIRKIVLERLGYCRVCHRHHEETDVHVVSQKPDVWMMVVECPDCSTRSFVAAVVDETQADEAKVALRRMAGEHFRKEREATALAHAEPVSEQDVQEMRDFLQTFNGDFKALFAKG
ncbi:MAG: hypothetical protein M3Y37_04675 [Chloroflexota bacterium]|nr:hypothetical protein [Chloroflexota bacterium]